MIRSPGGYCQSAPAIARTIENGVARRAGSLGEVTALAGDIIRLTSMFRVRFRRFQERKRRTRFGGMTDGI
jgi:hypothetical protein